MPRPRTASILALVLSAALVATAADARAITAVERARKDRREAAHTIADLRRLLHSHASSRRTAITLLEVLEVRGGSHLDPSRWRAAQRITARHDRKADRAVARVRRRVDRRIDQLLTQRDRLAAWLEVTAVFQVCPVDRYIALYDDFGEMVRLPKVPLASAHGQRHHRAHRHADPGAVRRSRSRPRTASWAVARSVSPGPAATCTARTCPRSDASAG